MTSDSHTRYGSRVRRQGRSRWKWRNQASRFPRNAARSCPVSMARREILAQVAKDSRNYIFDLSLFLFEEDDKGRTPDGVGEEAARLAGDDDLEKFRRCSELGDELLLGIARERLYDGEVPKNIENVRSEEHTSELQSQSNLVCRLLLEKKIIT